MKMIWLIMMLAIPLVLIFYYESIKMGIIDTYSINQKMESTRKEINTQKGFNSK